MTQQQLVSRLRELKTVMLDVAAEMCYLGGFGEISERGMQLARSARIVEAWADELDSAPDAGEAEK